MAAAGDKQESNGRLRSSKLLGRAARAAGSTGDPERPTDGLPAERIEEVAAYVDAFPSDDDDRARANEDLRGYSRRDPGVGEGHAGARE
jgi:hypothetical protein